MSTLANDQILADGSIESRLDLNIINRAARGMAGRLRCDGFAVARFEPGDSTEYVVTIVSSPHYGAPFLFASSFGPLAPWMGTADTFPSYAAEKYVGDGSEWTAIVLSVFLNAVAEEMTM
jgi:hypothetical protein